MLTTLSSMNGSRSSSTLRLMDDRMFSSDSSAGGFEERGREDEFLNDSYTSSIVEITDIDSRGNNTPYHTTVILKRCRQQVLMPYWKLLFLIGWRPFGRDRINYHWGWRILNLIYPVLLVALMFYVYTYRILSCQSRYDVPIAIVTTTIPVTNSSPALTTTIPANSSYDLTPSVDTYHLCTHLATSYILPDILHFMAFLLGFWYFRVQDNEQMDALIQQAFLHATPNQHGSNTQAMMIKTMKWILVGGALWVLVAIGKNILFLVAFGLDNTVYPFFTEDAWNGVNIALLCLNMFGCLIYNLINTAVVVNYTVQCETIICFVRSIRERLLEKTSDLRMIMHDILKVWQATQQLNGPMAKMMSLCAFNFASLVIVGISLLLFHRNVQTTPLVVTYRMCYLLVWLTILVFPFVQAARLSATYNKFEQAALEMRVFGYQTASPQELDSFLQFVSTAKCKVRLLFIPVMNANVYGTLLLVSFLLLILVQTGVIKGPSNYL
ncbi:uncharacterized protein LOC117298778 [Asterias rubens]|uniref:uncharacterized protein LOC117298778 n=1 Tax=Asterias rubens TaxID=7604 RepID=UPI0014559118|nr:uncharacterized protein LOC117298778 [Asterias rubens]